MSEAGGKPLRVLMVHAAYQQRGGEDSVVDAELALLRAHGHEVALYVRHNDEAEGAGRLSLAAQALWSTRASREVAALIAARRPDVVHVHNTWPLVSPSVYWPAYRAGVPVVQTLHNFRLMCPQAMFLREGKICEDCLGTVPWRGVMRGCYRGSRAQTAVLATTVQLHRAIGSYDRAVTLFVALSAFSKRKLVEGGLAADKIVIKPNFVDDLGAGAAGERSGGLFVGRLSDEKGVGVLLGALRHTTAQVYVAGDGDWRQAVQAQLADRWLGFQPMGEVIRRMKESAYLVLPSLCGENFPRTIAEAFCCGLPVIASRLGAMAELIEDGVTGLLFEVGNEADLAAKLEWAERHPDEMRRMGHAARARYEALYTPERNHAELMAIYAEAQRRVRTRS